MFTAMAAVFVLALTIPEAFDDAPGGLSGPVVVAVCYFVFRALHLLLFSITRGLALAGALWWAYFGVSSAAGEHALGAAAEDRRAGLARDAHSFLHLPLVAGIVLLALGLKKALEYVGDEQAIP